MPLIVNGVTIPTNGNFAKVGNTDLTKVVCNGTTVWEKIVKVTPSNSDISSYIDISGASTSGSTSGCSGHSGCPRFDASVWYKRNGGGSEDKTYVVRPKAPFTKIKATFHSWGLRNADSDRGSGCWVNGEEIGYATTIEASSFTIRCYARTNGWSEHWKTEAYCCMYDVTLS